AISSTWIIRALDSETRRGSSHALDLLGQDLDGDADFTGTPVTVAVLTRVLLGERVDVLVGSLLGHLDDSPAALEVSVRGVGLLDLERALRVALEVLVLPPSRGRVEPDVGAVVVDPHRRHLRRAVAADGRDVGERLLAQQITVALGHHRHRRLSFSTWSRILSVNRSSSSVRRRGRRPSSG